MNILFISHDASRSGAPLILLDLMKHFKSHNVSFSILLINKGPLYYEFLEFGVDIYDWSETNLKDLSDELKSSFDLIYLNTIAGIQEAGYLSKICGLPIVAHIHELNSYLYQFIDHFNSSADRIIKYIACSEIVKNNLIKSHSVDPEKIDVVYSFPCNKAILETTSYSVTSKKSEFIVGGCGSINFRKGVDLFIDVAQWIKKLNPEAKIKFQWIGHNSGDSYYYLLIDMISKLGLKDSVEFLGEFEDSSEIYSKFDIFLLTSREDPFPLVTLESSSLSIPVLYFDNTTGSEEFLKINSTLCIPFADTKMMGERILKEFYGKPQNIKSTGRQLADEAKKFTSENSFKKLYAILESTTFNKLEIEIKTAEVNKCNYQITLNEVWSRLYEEYDKDKTPIYLYGAGKFTKNLIIQNIFSDKSPKIEGIIDDKGVAETFLAGLPIIPTEKHNFGKKQLLFVSTDSFVESMTSKISEKIKGDSSLVKVMNLINLNHDIKISSKLENIKKLKPVYESANFKSTTPKVRTIAFYLPQFHRIKENDEWWGKGFTEWTNVAKGSPKFEGHIQPKIPADLGFYNLNFVDTLIQQAELAKKAGLEGFCFYYYWFSGKTLLETPLLNLLKNPEIDLPFCLCWANENWTRSWDGEESNILLEQKYDSEDSVKFMKCISKYIKDERYIKIDNRPLLLVYRPQIIDNCKEWSRKIKDYALNNGLGKIFLAGVECFNFYDPNEFGLDALVEFPPNSPFTPQPNSFEGRDINSDFNGRIVSYSEYSQFSSRPRNENFELFRTVMPAWDNTARRDNNSTIFADSTPEIYGDWIEKIIEQTLHKDKEKRLIFINAWNEWAEGAYLEPDIHFGHAYLNKTSEFINE